MTRRGLVRSTIAGVAAALCAPAGAFAAAGGGSSGFGGGGGGSFGGGGGGGGSFGGGGGGGPFVVSSDPKAVLIGLFFIFIFFAVIWAMGRAAAQTKMKAATWSRQYAKWRDETTEGRRTRRAKQIPPAARTAAEDDPHFAQDAVTQGAERLFRAIQDAWDARDQAALRTMVAPELMVEWSRRLNDFDRRGWHNRVAVKGLRTEYVGMTNRADDDRDLVVVRVSALLDDYVLDGNGNVIPHSGNPSTEAHLREYWTLGMRDGRWMLLSIEQDDEGEYQLEAPLITLPEDDVGAIRDEAVVELGVDAKAPPGTRLGDLVDVDFADDALTAARDLALIDGRLNPDVIEVSVRRAISGWAEAVDGEDEALLDVAPPAIAQDLLHPDGAQTRLVVRGPKMRKATVSELDPSDPIRVAIEAEVTGVRYIEDRDTVAVVSGDKNAERTFTERFVLQLTDDPENPWQLVAAAELSAR